MPSEFNAKMQRRKDIAWQAATKTEFNKEARKAGIPILLFLVSWFPYESSQYVTTFGDRTAKLFQTEKVGRLGHQWVTWFGRAEPPLFFAPLQLCAFALNLNISTGAGSEVSDFGFRTSDFNLPLSATDKSAYAH